MTLTVVVGSSGSGKTTFLNNVHELHKCTYIRQYHTLRPYIPVRKIPDFDPTQLPYWSLYSQKTLKGSDAKNVSYNPDVKIGGTMAGEFVAGLSGGQRKMMLFELVRQRTSGLLEGTNRGSLWRKRVALECIDEALLLLGGPGGGAAKVHRQLTKLQDGLQPIERPLEIDVD